MFLIVFCSKCSIDSCPFFLFFMVVVIDTFKDPCANYYYSGICGHTFCGGFLAEKKRLSNSQLFDFYHNECPCPLPSDYVIKLLANRLNSKLFTNYFKI